MEEKEENIGRKKEKKNNEEQRERVKWGKKGRKQDVGKQKNFGQKNIVNSGSGF